MIYMIAGALLLSATHCLAMNPITDKRLRRVQEQSGFTFADIATRAVQSGAQLRPPLQRSESGASQVAHSSKSSSNNSGRMHPFAVRSRSSSASTQLSGVMPQQAEPDGIIFAERILFPGSGHLPQPRSGLQSPRQPRQRADRAVHRGAGSESTDSADSSLHVAPAELTEIAEEITLPVPPRKKTSWWALFACTRTTSAD